MASVRFFDFAAVAIAFAASKTAGGEAPIGDAFDVHGNVESDK